MKPISHPKEKWQNQPGAIDVSARDKIRLRVFVHLANAGKSPFYCHLEIYSLMK
jgi:hypothetical protein